MQYDKLVDRFSLLLAEQTRAGKQQEESLRAAGRSDDATLQKINGNVIEIFAKMFAVCRRDIEQGFRLPALREAVRGCGTPLEQLAVGYPSLCRNIMAPWKQKLEAARIHGDTIGAVIETNKLETAEQLLDVFESLVIQGVKTDG